MFKPSASAEVQDWITPLQVELVRVLPHPERFEQIKQRANQLREAMGPRYLCHEKNRVQRLDGRNYQPREAIGSNVRTMKRKDAA